MQQSHTASLPETIIEHAEAKCKQNGGQLTDKRKKILLCLAGSDKALSAYEVAELYKREFNENMSAMSVYRILDFLQQQSLVHRLQIANKYISCVHITCSHNHDAAQFLICSNCFKVKEVSIDSNLLNELRRNICDAGFMFVGHQLELNCLCEECRSD